MSQEAASNALALRERSETKRRKTVMVTAIAFLLTIVVVTSVMAIRFHEGKTLQSEARTRTLPAKSVVIAQGGKLHIFGESSLSIQPGALPSVSGSQPLLPAVWIFRDNESLSAAPCDQAGLFVGVAYRQRTPAPEGRLHQMGDVDLSKTDEEIAREYGVVTEHDNESALQGSTRSPLDTKYPSEPFAGYPPQVLGSIVEICRSHMQFDILTEDEAAYKALLMDAHYLYAGFLQCYESSIHGTIISAQLSRFRFYRAPVGEGSPVQIPSADLRDHFHFNRSLKMNVWTMQPDFIIDGIRNGTVACGNLQWDGRAWFGKDGQFCIEGGTTLVYPSTTMPQEATEYRHFLGVKAGYLPSSTAAAAADDLVKKAAELFESRSVRGKVEAVKLWTHEAEMGNVAAQFNLGATIVNGDWLTSDAAEAIKWFILAASAGHDRAQQALNDLRQRRIGDEAYAEGRTRAEVWKASSARSSEQSAVAAIEAPPPQKSRSGRCRILSIPNGASVFVRGTEITGVTPIDLPQLAEGQYEVRVELAGHISMVRNVDVTDGKSVVEEFRLERK